MAKRGPPKKFTAAVKTQIVDDLALGLSLADALLIAGFSRRSYRLACKEDPEFCRGVKAAASAGKRHHLRRVRDAEERWQASAWFLERKYGAEYGQKLKVNVEASDADADRALAAEVEKLTARRAAAGAGPAPPPPGPGGHAGNGRPLA